MDHSILIVEPDSSRGKQVVRILLQAGYDAFITSCAEKTLRQLFQIQPDAVILSDRLPSAELDRLSDSITMMSDLPLIELGDAPSFAASAQRPTHLTELPELVKTLDELLEPVKHQNFCVFLINWSK